MWLPYPAVPPTPFAHHYLAARRAFLAALKALPAHQPRHHQTVLYPSGNEQLELATDLLWLGDPNAERLLVLISGTHGVEGFCGSAIQSDLLQTLAKTNHWPPSVACLIIHALNPFGMQWWRRCDAWGIDLNRNFVDFSAPLPANLGFVQLQPFLNEVQPEQRQRAFEAFIQQHGQGAFEEALSGGQYLDPHGAFYGGTGANPSRQLIDRLLAEQDFSRKRLIVLDIHTGLGPFGYGELICDHQPQSPQAAFAAQHFGSVVTLPALGTSSSVPKAGLQDYAWHAVMGNDACFLTLEYGTHGTQALFDAILDDHILHRSAALDSTLFQHPVKRAMREHFCPDNRLWEQLVLAQARLHINTALEALQS